MKMIGPLLNQYHSGTLYFLKSISYGREYYYI